MSSLFLCVQFCTFRTNVRDMFVITVRDSGGFKNELFVAGSGESYSLVYNSVEIASGVLPATIPMPEDLDGNIKKGLYTVTINGDVHVFDYQYEPAQLQVATTVNGFLSSIRIEDTTDYGDAEKLSSTLTVTEPTQSPATSSSVFTKTGMFSGEWEYSFIADIKHDFPSDLSILDRIAISGSRIVYNITTSNVFNAADSLFREYEELSSTNTPYADRLQNQVISVQALLNSFNRYLIANNDQAAYDCLDEIASIVSIPLTEELIAPFSLSIGSSIDTYKSKLDVNDTARYLGEIIGSTLRVVNGKIETVTRPPITAAGTYNTVTVNSEGYVTSGSNTPYQPLNTRLTNLTNVSTNGFLVKNGDNYITRSLQGMNKIQVENGDGLSGLINIKHEALTTPPANQSGKLVCSLTFDQYGHVLSASSKTAVEAIGYTPENAAFKGLANGYAPLDSNSKIPSQYISISGMTYKGMWNADTNTPTLANGVGKNGDWYSVSIGGTSLGITWTAGDRAIYNGIVWQREPNISNVGSVFGRVGNIEAQGGDYANFYVRYDAVQTITQPQANQVASNLLTKFFTYDQATDTYVLDGKVRFTGDVSSYGNIIAYQGGGVIEDDIMNRIRIATPSEYGIVKYDNLTIGLNSSGQLQILGSLLPNQSGNMGKFLRTNGTSAFWDSIPPTYTDAQAINALLPHTSNTDIHITSSERISWNNKLDRSRFEGLFEVVNEGQPNQYIKAKYDFASTGNITAYASGSPVGSIWDSMPLATTTTIGGIKIDDVTLKFNGNNQLYVAGGLLPNQSGNIGKYLRTDGSNPYWDTLPADIMTLGSNQTITGLKNFTTAPTINSNTIWHSGNANRSDTDWNARNLYAGETGRLVMQSFGRTLPSYNANNAINNSIYDIHAPEIAYANLPWVGYGTLTTFRSANGILQIAQSSNDIRMRGAYGSTPENNFTSWVEMWHSGNSNKNNVDWTANQLISNSLKLSNKNFTYDSNNDELVIGANVRFVGNVYANGNIVAYSDGGVLSSIWDSMPLMTTTTIGGAKYDGVTLGINAQNQLYVINAGSASSVPWSGITGKPTTLSGYGITDAMTSTAIAAAIAQSKAEIIDNAPTSLNTLKEIALAINNDASYNTTISTLIGTKAPIASPNFTGTPTINNNTIWHAGNSNRGDTNWTANQLIASSLRLSSKDFTYDSGNDEIVIASNVRFQGNVYATGNVTAYASGGIGGSIWDSMPIATSIVVGGVKIDDVTIKINGQNQIYVAGGILPSQSGNTGKYLRTNGTNPYWDSLPADIATLTYVDSQLLTKEPTINAGTTGQYWSGDKTWQTLNTSAVVEGSSLYFTNARSRGSISLTTTGNSGASTYNSSTGVFNIPNYSLVGLGGQPQLNGTGFVKANGTTISYDNSIYTTLDTSQTITGLKNFTTAPTINSNTIWHSGNANRSDTDWTARYVYAGELGKIVMQSYGRTLPSYNANNAINNSIYDIHAPEVTYTNLPWDGYGTLTTFRSSNGISQIAQSGNDIRIRGAYGVTPESNFTSWVKIYHSDNSNKNDVPWTASRFINNLYGVNQDNARNHFSQYNQGNATIASGWIAAAFGDNNGSRVVVGQADSKAIIGAHDGNLGAWSDLTIKTALGETVYNTSGEWDMPNKVKVQSLVIKAADGSTKWTASLNSTTNSLEFFNASGVLEMRLSQDGALDVRDNVTAYSNFS